MSAWRPLWMVVVACCWWCPWCTWCRKVYTRRPSGDAYMYLLDHLNKMSELLIHGLLAVPCGKWQVTSVDEVFWCCLLFLFFFSFFFCWRFSLLALFCFSCRMVRIWWVTSGLTTPRDHRIYFLTWIFINKSIFAESRSIFINKSIFAESISISLTVCIPFCVFLSSP